MTAFEKTVLFSFVSKNILKSGAGGSKRPIGIGGGNRNSCRFAIKTRHYRIKRCSSWEKMKNQAFHSVGTSKRVYLFSYHIPTFLMDFCIKNCQFP